jgi:hypothetical protein
MMILYIQIDTGSEKRRMCKKSYIFNSSIDITFVNCSMSRRLDYYDSEHSDSIARGWNSNKNILQIRRTVVSIDDKLVNTVESHACCRSLDDILINESVGNRLFSLR